MEEKERNGILIVIAFFELRRMNFSKTWIELIIWGTISKRAWYKWRVSTYIPKHRNRQGKWVATRLKTTLCPDIPLVFCILPLGAEYWMKDSHWWFVFHFSCPDIRRNAPSSVWYITSESLHITRDSTNPTSVFEHTQSVLGCQIWHFLSCVFVKSRWSLNLRRNTPTRLL